ncbi:glycoside hydrolase [Geomonas sp. Red69]|uniref:Glycoside hydrolase n=1 Tax=Geomonas diazotrophica TaxID=2843197 RepID=A0ABX8JQK0_9BACT|nr:glycoside hydrolase [Geomonas diazotrophica]QWV99712.1 glycoside hydrolase [Geomonas nitrogeniifigens]QXE88847.1 glycoside hydrolase [Geomonas nitrogeniifigens]
MHGDETALLEECYRQALLLLRENSTPDGILASARNRRSSRRNYDAIFGRDAAICSLGMALSGDFELLQAAEAGLLTLARHQARNGQIPKFVKPEIAEVDFWYAGCVDATVWWLIAVHFLDRVAPQLGLAERLSANAVRALSWLECQEHQGWHLLQQNDCADWADIMPRSGFVLYTNALWYWAKRLYNLPTARATRDFARLLFNPFDNAIPDQKRVRLMRHYVRNGSRPAPFLLSYVNFSFWGEEIDIFGNILAYLTGLGVPSDAGKMVAGVAALSANDPHPVRVVGTPIEVGSPRWRPYMQRHRQNLPWQYHNGGAWPFVGGFWVVLLAMLGERSLARAELVKLALSNRVNGWEFNEWFQGQTGEPMGMPRQSWNAAMYLVAFRVLADGTRIFPQG